MSAHLRNEMRKEALLALGSKARPRLGTVTSFDKSSWAVKVMVQPEEIETGWIPLKSIWGGNGWGIFAAPINGAQVEISFQEDHPEAGLCGDTLFSDEDRPLPAEGGELWIVHQSGAFWKLLNDGSLTFGDGQGAVVTLKSGQITSSGAWTHTGNFTASGTITGQTDVVANGTSGHTHKHSGVQTGSGQTGTPV